MAYDNAQSAQSPADNCDLGNSVHAPSTWEKDMRIITLGYPMVEQESLRARLNGSPTERL